MSRLRIDDSSSAGNNSVDIGGGGGGIAVIFFVRYFVVDVFHAIAVAVGEERRGGKERGGEGCSRLALQTAVTGAMTIPLCNYPLPSSLPPSCVPAFAWAGL